MQLGNDRFAGARIARDIQENLAYIPIIYCTGLPEKDLEKATEIAWPDAKPLRKTHTQLKLSKLYDLESLERALNLVLRSSKAYLGTPIMTFEGHKKDHFQFDTKYDCRKFQTNIYYDNISYIECYKRYIYIYLNDSNEPVISYSRKSLISIWDCLTPWKDHFFSIDKSTIIHKKYIKGVAIDGRFRIIYLKPNGIEKKLFVARNKVKVFEEWWQSPDI